VLLKLQNALLNDKDGTEGLVRLNVGGIRLVGWPKQERLCFRP